MILQYYDNLLKSLISLITEKELKELNIFTKIKINKAEINFSEDDWANLKLDQKILTNFNPIKST